MPRDTHDDRDADDHDDGAYDGYDDVGQDAGDADGSETGHRGYIPSPLARGRPVIPLIHGDPTQGLLMRHNKNKGV